MLLAETFNRPSIRDLISATNAFMDTDGYLRLRSDLHQLLSDERVRLNTKAALTHATEPHHIEHLADKSSLQTNRTHAKS